MHQNPLVMSTAGQGASNSMCHICVTPEMDGRPAGSLPTLTSSESNHINKGGGREEQKTDEHFPTQDVCPFQQNQSCEPGSGRHICGPHTRRTTRRGKCMVCLVWPWPSIGKCTDLLGRPSGPTMTSHLAQPESLLPTAQKVLPG